MLVMSKIGTALAVPIRLFMKSYFLHTKVY